jgi:hypothetical protein
LSSATAAFEDIDAATRHFLHRTLNFAGALPEDARLRELIASGKSLQQAAALGSPAVSASHELVGRLVRQLAGLAPVPLARSAGGYR